jgi:hypothetical protein
MRNALRLLCLCSLVLLASCTNGDKPTDVTTAPGAHFDAADVGACPVALPLAFNAAPTVPTNFQLLGSDADGDVITYMVVSPPLHGTVVVSGSSGAGTYTSVPGYCGPDDFSYVVRDAPGCNSTPAPVVISVCGTSPPPDTDEDGVPDADDDCDESDLSETVEIGTCDTGVLNLIGGELVNTDGCSLADLVAQAIATAEADAASHGRFVAALTRSLMAMSDDGAIAQKDIGLFIKCVGGSDVKKGN